MREHIFMIHWNDFLAKNKVIHRNFPEKRIVKENKKIVLTIQYIVCIINQCEMGDYDANQFIKTFIR